MSDAAPSSDQLEGQYKIRQVTQYQASWTEKGRGEPGLFTIQLVLDNGVEEYILAPDEDDADLIFKLLERSKHTTFDLGRKVLMFSNLDAD